MARLPLSLKCWGSEVKFPPERRQYSLGPMVHMRDASGRRDARKMVRHRASGLPVVEYNGYILGKYLDQHATGCIAELGFQ